jgi:uncharacterized damage-inducible protein DinB
MTISQRILSDYEAEADMTRTMLASVPGDKLDWRPHAKSWTLGELAGHVAESPNWLGAMLEDEMDFAEMGDYKPFVPTSKDELMEAFEKSSAGVAPILDGKDDDFMGTTWTMKMAGKEIMSKPKRDVIRSIILHHWAHHRGQLSVYLRLLDVPVPKTYGPTADDTDF